MRTIIAPPHLNSVTVDDLDLLTRSLRDSEVAQYVQNCYREQGRFLSVHNKLWDRTDKLDESTASRVMSIFWKRSNLVKHPDSFSIDPEYTFVWGTNAHLGQATKINQSLGFASDQSSQSSTGGVSNNSDGTEQTVPVKSAS
jgi:hypothetical protein